MRARVRGVLVLFNPMHASLNRGEEKAGWWWVVSKEERADMMMSLLLIRFHIETPTYYEVAYE